MKITKTSPDFKRSNINHVCEQARITPRSPERHWSFDNTADVNTNKNRFDLPRARDKKRESNWVFNYVEKVVQPCNPAPVLQCVRVAALNDCTSKGCKFTVKTDNGEETRYGRIITRTLHIGPFGSKRCIVEFRKSQRGRNVRDMRTNTLVSPEYATSEIYRLIGDENSAKAAVSALFATK